MEVLQTHHAGSCDIFGIMGLEVSPVDSEDVVVGEPVVSGAPVDCDLEVFAGDLEVFAGDWEVPAMNSENSAAGAEA